MNSIAAKCSNTTFQSTKIMIFHLELLLTFLMIFMIYRWKYIHHSFLWRTLLMWSVSLLLLLLCTVLQMLLNEHFAELFLTVLTHHHLYFLFFHVVNICFTLLFSLLFLVFLHCLDSWSEVLWRSFPVFTSFGLIKSFSSGHSHLFLFLSFGLFSNLSLNKQMLTCSFPTLLASELNSFLFDINTNLQALACFSKAFLLNFLPQPSGQSTKSF